MKLNIYQIYYDDFTKGLIRPGFIPFYNEECTVFFEGDVIRKCIEKGLHRESDYFGVISPTFEHKMNTYFHQRFNEYGHIYSFAEKNKDADYISLTRMPKQNPLLHAEAHHKGYTEIMEEVLRQIGFTVFIKPIEHFTLCNFFIAKQHFWDRFTRELMFPFMDYTIQSADTNSLLFKIWRNARRNKTLPHHLQLKFGVPHYTYHPFLIERLVGIFLMKYGEMYTTKTYK